VPGFNPGGEQPLTIGKELNSAIADSIMGEHSRFARSVGTRLSCPPFAGLVITHFPSARSLPLRHRQCVPERAIRIAQKHGIVRSPAVAFFFE